MKLFKKIRKKDKGDDESSVATPTSQKSTSQASQSNRRGSRSMFGLRRSRSKKQPGTDGSSSEEELSSSEEGQENGPFDGPAAGLPPPPPGGGVPPPAVDNPAMPPPLAPAPGEALQQKNSELSPGKLPVGSPEQQGGGGGGGFMGTIMEEAVFQGVLQYRVHWKDTEEDTDDWIEDYVLKAEFPQAIAEWEQEKARRGLPPGPPGEGLLPPAPPSPRELHYEPDERLLEELCVGRLRTTAACLTDADHMARAARGVAAGLLAGDAAGLRLVTEVLEQGRPDGRWLDAELRGLRELELDLRDLAERGAGGPGRDRLGRQRAELGDTRRAADGLRREVRALEDALDARRRNSEAAAAGGEGGHPRTAAAAAAAAARRQGPLGPGGGGGGARPLQKLPDELHQTVEVSWDPGQATHTAGSLQDMFSQFGRVDRVMLHPDPGISSVLVVYQNKVGSQRALKAEFSSVTVRRPGANAFSLFRNSKERNN